MNLGVVDICFSKGSQISTVEDVLPVGRVAHLKLSKAPIRGACTFGAVKKQTNKQTLTKLKLKDESVYNLSW